MIRAVVIVCVLAACGGGSSPDEVCACDAPPPIDEGVCNPVAQTGCFADEKCTWIHDQADPDVGHLACVQLSGTEVAIGEPCAYGPPGPQGFDNCAKGGICLDGTCKTACGFADTDPSCGATQTCNRYPGTFEIAGSILAGACDPLCDPLTQAELAPACGSPDPATPTRGCYTFDLEAFACTSVPPAALDLTDRKPAIVDLDGNALVNGCAPGFVPLLFESTGSTTITCTGLCAPLEIDNTQPQNALGDPAALGKLPREAAPAAGNATCAVGKKGSEPEQQCMFVRAFRGLDTGPLDEILGMCFAYTHFKIDTDGDGVPESPFPACATLPPRSGATPSKFDDAADFGCQTLEHSQRATPALRGFRIGGLRGGAITPHAWR